MNPVQTGSHVLLPDWLLKSTSDNKAEMLKAAANTTKTSDIFILKRRVS